MNPRTTHSTTNTVPESSGSVLWHVGSFARTHLGQLADEKLIDFGIKDSVGDKLALDAETLVATIRHGYELQEYVVARDKQAQDEEQDAKAKRSALPGCS